MSRQPTISRGPLAVLVLTGTAVGLYLLMLAASFVDPAFGGGQIGRNISLGGTPLSGTAIDDLDATIDDLRAVYQTTPVEIDAGHGPAESSAGRLGLSLDVATSAREVEEANQVGSVLTRPVEWVGSFFRDEDVAPRYTLDETVLHDALVEVDLPGITGWTLPDLEADADGVRVVAGQPGAGIDLDGFGDRLLAAAETGEVPIRVTPDLVDLPPPVDDDDLEPVAAAAEAATDQPLDVRIGDRSETLDVATLRSWLYFEITDTNVDWRLDLEAIEAHVEERFADVGGAGSDAEFGVIDGQVVLVPSSPRTACCEDGSAERIVDALVADDDTVELALIAEPRERDEAWAESLGIVEEVASFTTEHACCQNRVVNIHLIADATRGVIIEPGETFSLNDHVGRRTEEKGYLPAGGISYGVLVDQLGGGVSQYTTTLFNAAFFAGLDFGEYQAHSIYFPRYPYGREATLSHPHPDLQIRNNTPYGVLVWPTYTDTSITVTLYSTRHVTAEQTDQTETEDGVCTRVRTERTRTYDDGRVEVDHVTARYRPAEGIDCSGEPSQPPPGVEIE